VLCAGCGTVQPPDNQADAFQVLGVERRYGQDIGDLERRYKNLTKILHPDRWARADARARRSSLERSVQLTHAWRVLRDPIERAEYLLALDKVEIGGTVPQDLLLEVMNLRESLAAARQTGNVTAVASLANEVRGRLDAALGAVAGAFVQPAPDLGHIAQDLVPIRYWRRFLDEVATAEEALGNTKALSA
jgi:molecular chaperone HscB